MNIARPVNGFHVKEHSCVRETLAANRQICPWLMRAYESVIQHLKLAGHVSGHASTTQKHCRLYIEADPETETNRLVVAYHVLGDTLTVLSIMILVKQTEN
jgi:hypothetical protein